MQSSVFGSILLMENKLTDKDLCSALSDLFLDVEIHYETVARVAKNHDLHHVEDVLLDWVAPVLHWAYYSVAQNWTGYDEDWLWDEVQKVALQKSNAGFVMKRIIAIRRRYMKRLLKNVWLELSTECKRQRDVD